MKLGLVLFLISIATSLILLDEKIQLKLTDFLFGTERSVLAQMEMDMDGQKYKVIKVSSIQGLAVEVYRYTDEGPFFIDSQFLTDKKDGFYKFENKKYNLFLKDINGDGRNEIVTPTVDKNMKGRLNVFFFDPDTEQLKKMTKH